MAHATIEHRGRKNLRWFPAGAVKVQDKQRLGTVFVYEKNGKPLAVGYTGNRAKPDFHNSYQNELYRQRRIAEWFDGLAAQARARDQYRQRTNEDPLSRNNVIKAIKAHLRARGLDYSVTGGRGTAWGWIHIDLLPSVAKLLTPDQVRAAEKKMNEEFGLNYIGAISIAASHDYYREYLERAQGLTPTKLAEPYWD